MLQCRILGERVSSMSRRSQAWGKYALSPVGEAVAVGAAIDLRREDWIVPSRGDCISAFVKGVPLTAIFSRFVASRKTTSARGYSAPASEDCSLFHIIPPSATAAAQINLAAGVALAMQAQKNGNVVMAFVDGPISGVPLHNALNFVGEQCLPLAVIVQIEAGSMRRKNRPSNLLGTAHPRSFPVIPVDAQDVVAVYRVAHESIHKARHGGGPTLIEATLFRLPANRSVAIARRGRSPDAIGKMEDYLIAKGLLSPTWKQHVLDRFNRDVTSAIESAERTSLRKPVRAL